MNIDFAENLQDCVTRCGARLDQIERELFNAVRDSERERELKAEKSDISMLRKFAQQRLETAVAQPIAAERKALIDVLTQERFEVAMQGADRFEAQHDYHNARLHRIQALQTRQLISRELNAGY